MAGDLVISDRFVAKDIRNLEACGVTVTVLLDLTHKKDKKPAHLDIELDFQTADADSFNELISQLKQKYSTTYKKLSIKKLNPKRKNYTAKIEVKSFGRSIIKDAKNSRTLKDAMTRWEAGEKSTKMLKVKF